MKMIHISNHSISADHVSHIVVHSVGKSRYEPLLPATRTVLDIRSSTDDLIWTRIFDSPEEALWARDLIVRAIGAGVPGDLETALNDWNPKQKELFDENY